MAQSRLDILVNARNQTRGAFAEIKRELESIDNAAGVAGRGLSGIGAVIGAGAIVAGLQQIGSALDDLGRRGAIFQQLGNVLDDYAASVGSSAEQFIAAGKKASQGTIGDYDLILNANRAIQFEVAQTSEQYAQLIELATALGRAQGISDTQALDYITTGIARESRLILDNLGLIIDLDKATKEYAATLGKQADQLTQAERKAALLAAAYAQGATAIAANRDAAGSAATTYERFDANLQTLKDRVGELIAEFANPALKDAADYIERINDKLETTATERAANQMQALGTHIAEVAERIEGLQAISQGASAIGNLADTDAANAKLDELRAQVEALGNAYNKQAAIAKTPLLDIGQLQQGVVAFESEEQAAQRAAQALAVNADASSKASMEATRLAAASRDGADGLSTMEAMAWSTATSLDAVTQAAGRASAVSGRLSAIRNAAISQAEGLALRAVQAGGDPAMIAQLYAEQADQIQNMGLNMEMTNEAMFENKLLVMGAGENYNAMLGGIIEADKETQRLARSTGGVSEAAQAAQQQFDDLRSKVEGVLSGALTLDVGVNPDDILPREDAINENARRLADVAVKGFDSPWFDYFKNNFPALFQEYFAGAADGDGVKMQAAQLLRNFEEGLQPELLDKEKAKERVRRILLGEQNMAALAQEIAAELSAEFGNSISLGKIQATAGAALGVDEGQSDALTESLSATATNVQAKLAGIGGDFRAGILSALDGIGEAVANALDKQLRAESSLKIINDAGAVSGQAWGAGFLTAVDSLSSGVLEKLAGLVAPYLEAAQARNATLNGAN